MDFSYTTNVKISKSALEELLPQLKADFDVIGTRDTSEGRSKFSIWNNIQKFYDRLAFDGDTVVLPVTGSSKGGTARVYFKPSVTSYAKPFRKCVVPLNPDNEFAYFDLCFYILKKHSLYEFFRM